MQRWFLVVFLCPAAVAVWFAPKAHPEDSEVDLEVEVEVDSPWYVRSDVQKCTDDFYGLQCEHGIQEFPYCKGGWHQIDRMIGQMRLPGYRYRQQIAAEWLKKESISTVLDLGAYVNPMSNFLDTTFSKVRDVIVVDPLTRERDVDKLPGRPMTTIVRALFEDVFLTKESVLQWEMFDAQRSALVFMGMAGCYGEADNPKSTVRSVLTAVIPHFKHLIVEYADGADDDNCRKCWKHIEDTFVKTGKYSVVKRHDLDLALLGIPPKHFGGGSNRRHRHMVHLAKSHNAKVKVKAKAKAKAKATETETETETEAASTAEAEAKETEAEAEAGSTAEAQAKETETETASIAEAKETATETASTAEAKATAPTGEPQAPAEPTLAWLPSESGEATRGDGWLEDLPRAI